MTLPADVARCDGRRPDLTDSIDRECFTCLRRLELLTPYWRNVVMLPPALVDGKCPMRIAEGQS